MSPIALLILAAVAGFLFYNLRSVLGQTPYDVEKRNKARNKDLKSDDKYITNSKDTEVCKTIPLEVNNKFLKGNKSNQDELIKSLNSIQEKYSGFILHEFIDGVKTAYQMILESFADNKLGNIEPFVSDDIYNEFRNLRKSYNEKEYEYTNVITKIEDVFISRVWQDEKFAYITAEIKSHNVMSLKDKNKKIIHGDPKNIQVVNDEWTFKREFKSTSPAWVLIKK